MSRNIFRRYLEVEESLTTGFVPLERDQCTFVQRFASLSCVAVSQGFDSMVHTTEALRQEWEKSGGTRDRRAFISTPGLRCPPPLRSQSMRGISIRGHFPERTDLILVHTFLKCYCLALPLGSLGPRGVCPLSSTSGRSTLTPASAAMPPPGDRYKVKAKRHHAYTGFIFLIGFLLPPFAVAARFGLGKDFWINVLLTICGWVPGQIHNFYIQTMRNNKNMKRTPQWAVRHGLVDDSSIKRHKKRNEWSHRYNDRLPQSALDGAEFAPDQVPDASGNTDLHNPNQTISRRPSTIGGARSPAALWREDDAEGFYDRTKVEPPRGSKPRRNSGWRFDGGFPDEDAATGVGGSIYTGALAYLFDMLRSKSP
ncbi:hypothetical protein FRC10_001084 [Ceratobasidium sp. 414]|nr:hypothetical protein FRC10_001084 [Ceratobasidium sp. 414]